MKPHQERQAASWAAGILILGLLASGGYIVFRYFRMMRLFQIAVSPISTTATADEAVTTLDGYRGKRATDFLVRIATAEREFVDDRQEVAIRLIAQRDGAGASASLATLLQPHIELARRDAVANALQEGTCTIDCARSILHYEERLWCCQLAQENVLSVVTNPAVTSTIEKEHSEMMARLDMTLIRNSGPTLSVLREIYGLGSSDPSLFAFHIVGSLKLRQACPALVRSKERLLDPSQKDNLEGLVRQLNCLGDGAH